MRKVEPVNLGVHLAVEEETADSITVVQRVAEHTSRTVYHFNEEAIRAKLVRMGWRPPATAGLYPLPPVDVKCKHPDHDPGGMISVPSGYGYLHVCPACGAEQRIIGPKVTL